MEGHEPPQPQPKSSPDELCPASNPCVITPLSPAPADSKAATPKSDGQGATPATGPMALPTPQELPPASEPQATPPDQEEEGGSSWRYHPAVQGVSGFLGGVAFGVIPFAGVGEGVAQERGWIEKRTRAANIGKGIGEIVGGLFTFSGGVGGVVGGGVLTVTGIGAPAGVPAIVASAALVTGALANVAAGVATLQVALSQGGGGDGGSGAQDKALSKGEISALKDAGIDVHDLKPDRAGRYDLFKDPQGNIVVKPKGGAGPGDPTGLNVNDFMRGGQ